MRFLVVQLGLLSLSLETFLLKGPLLIHGEFIDVHLKFHAKLHDLLIFGNDLVLCLLKLQVSVSYLSFIVLDLDLNLVVAVLHLSHLRGVLVRETCQVRLELLDEFLFVAQLILDHV